MASTTVTASVERTWAALVDWPAHGRWVPLTTVRVTTPSGAGVGARFVGRTGLGRLAFDDPMEVVLWQPPGPGAGRCEVIKHGRIVRGSAGFEVTPIENSRAVRVTWVEDVDLAPVWLTKPFTRLIAVLGAFALGRSLRLFARDVTAAQ